jgi:arylformamidase
VNLKINKSSTGTGWIDVSVPLREDMAVFANEQKLRIERRASMERGDGSNNSTLHIGVHTGTHLDAPRHGIAGGKSIDQMPLDIAIGPARVIEIKDNRTIRTEELKQYEFKPGERVLFKTLNSQRCWTTDNFVADFVDISPEAAQFLADAGLSLIGLDYLSVRAPASPTGTHKILLGAGIWLLEGLNLAAVSAGNYDLICLPLRIIQTDGSPVRAVLRQIS